MARIDGQRTLLPLHEIKLDPELQPRAELDRELVEQYAAALADGATFPSITVFEYGGVYLLSDGYHRWHAHAAAKFDCIEAEIKQGDWRSALRWSLFANAKQGKPRQPADYHRAYQLAVSYNMVDKADTAGVARILGCGLRWAQRLTAQAGGDDQPSGGEPHLQAPRQYRTTALSSFAQRTAERRRERGLSQDRLAAMISVARPTIAGWELGTSWPSARVLPALATALETSVEWLVTGLSQTNGELQAIDLFRKLTPQAQELALRILRLLAAAPGPPASTAGEGANGGGG